MCNEGLYADLLWINLQRKLPSPGFQVEVVVVDYDNTSQPKPETETESTTKSVEGTSGNPPTPVASETTATNLPKDSKNNEKDDEVFSDTESEAKTDTASETNSTSGKIANLTNDTKNLSLGNSSSTQISPASGPKNDSPNPVAEVSDFKAMAADTSVFTFGDDDEDYESD